MVFITKSYQDLFGVRSYINALISVLTLAIMYTMAWHQAIALPTIMVEKDLLQIFITVFKIQALPC